MTTPTPEKVDVDHDVAPLTLDEEKLADDLLDTISPPTCEFHLAAAEPHCGDPAAWALLLSCGHVLYYCAPHHNDIDVYINRPPAGIACAIPAHPRPVRVSYEWRPIS